MVGQTADRGAVAAKLTKRRPTVSPLDMRVPVLVLLIAIATESGAQTVVPKLDAGGTAGEIARKMKQKSADRFDAADLDKDGRLSKPEATAISDYWAANFDKRDLNHDGFLSWEEFVGHNRWPK